jgi:hypothetical protein
MTEAGLPSAKITEALSPLPVRHHYVHPDNLNANPDDPTSVNSVLNNPGFPNRPGMNINQPGSQFHGGGPLPATPAPSPPLPSPKAKKQQYQTDQTKPFVFPFSPAAHVSNRLVPYAIDEADQLYSKHMHVSLALFQIWRTREDFILDESGLDEMPGYKEDDIRMKRWSVVSVKKGSSKLGALTSTSPTNASANISSLSAAYRGDDLDDEEEETVIWPDSKIVEDEIAKAETELKKLDIKIARDIATPQEKAERKRIKERKEDLLRIQRAETIYVRLTYLYLTP